MPLKRDPSLIPLSHDHHHALVRVFEIRQALRAEKDLEAQAEATRGFWRSSLVPHFEAEEAAVFPLLAEVGAAAEVLARLLDDHARMRAMIAALAPTRDQLAAFADLLESHIRLEERRLFPLYQEHVAPERRGAVEARVREILRRADDVAKACDLPPRRQGP